MLICKQYSNLLLYVLSVNSSLKFSGSYCPLTCFLSLITCHLGAYLPLPSSHLKNAMVIALTNHHSPLSQLMQADPHKLDFRNELLARLPGAGGLGPLGPLGGGLPSAHDLNRPASLFTAAGGCFCGLARYVRRKGAAVVCTIERERAMSCSKNTGKEKRFPDIANS